MVASISFNGLDINTDPYHIQILDGLLGSPEIRVSDYPRNSQKGMIKGVDKYSGRTVTIQVEITADVLDSEVAAFATAFAVPKEDDSPLQFTIPGVASGSPARLNVRPRKLALPIEFEYFSGTAYASAELFAADPLIYSEAETSVSINLATGAGGRTYDRTYDMSYGGIASYGSALLTNLGSAVAPLTIRINGPVTNPTIRNVTTGQSLGFTVALNPGEYLDIDTTARTVLLNGTADRYSYLTLPQWFGLVPGVNEIRYFADDTVASTANITFRSAWL